MFNDLNTVPTLKVLSQVICTYKRIEFEVLFLATTHTYEGKTNNAMSIKKKTVLFMTK